MTARHLVIGLDGADLDVVRELGRARLPALHAAMDRGAHAHLESVQPPATLPNWTTFLTGVDPGVHGVFDFTTRRGYSVRFTAGTVREAPTIAARLDRLGLACACIGFPATWPPEELAHGVFVSGWDAPVAFEADRSFVWPSSLYDQIVDRFGTPRFDDVDELRADEPGWHARLPDALVARTERKADLAEWLIERRRWDLFAVYFGESDTASHHLWSLCDESSPRHPPGTAARARDGLARVYEALDAAVGRLVEAAGGDRVELTIVSDHGSGGSSDKVLYLNRALADAGLCTLREGSAVSALSSALKRAALGGLPPRLRERLFRAGGAVLPSLLESRARFSAIDFDHTRAFSEELNYFPSVCLNVAGREPRGTVPPADVPRVRREVESALRAIRDPWTSAPVVREVWPREEIFSGPHVERAPDLLLELELDGDYSYALMPTASAPAGTGPWRKLDRDEHLGKKGRSLPGAHRPRGLYVAAGPRVAKAGQIDARIADATATLLARMDIAIPADAAGRVLFEILTDGASTERSRALPAARPPRAPAARDDARVIDRLRALGYVD